MLVKTRALPSNRGDAQCVRVSRKNIESYLVPDRDASPSRGMNRRQTIACIPDESRGGRLRKEASRGKRQAVDYDAVEALGASNKSGGVSLAPEALVACSIDEVRR